MEQFGLAGRFYYSRLNDTGKKAYRLLLGGMNEQKIKIRISDHQLAAKDLKKIYSAINLDNPEMFWPDYYKLKWINSLSGCTALPSYFYEKQEKETLHAQLHTWMIHVCGQIPSGVSEGEKVWMIYDYLARRVNYKKDVLALSNTVIGPMKKNYHASVCEGTAKAFKLLCEAAGIPCIVMIGDAAVKNSETVLHAWNMVRLGNAYRHVDATWEISHAHMRGIADDSRFLKKDSDMTCYSWNRTEVPLCR